MKTCLFSPCYLEGKDPSGMDRLVRMKRYLDYYEHIQDELGFDKVFLSDDGSSNANIEALLVGRERGPMSIRFMGNLKLMRQGGDCDYPWCWRALYQMRACITEGYQKIIMIDSDCFLLSKRLADYVKGLSSGWTAFHIPKYNFSSAEFHILCQDTFEYFLNYCETPFLGRNGQMMEIALPFTQVNRSFNVDRYGETKEQQESHMDFYSNSYGDAPMRFESYVKTFKAF